MNDRLKTFATKYTMRQELFGSEDVIPLWVADMDLPGAPEITEALIERAKHPIYGYTSLPKEYFQAYIDWQLRRNHHTVDINLMAYAENLVQGIQFVLSALFSPEDKIIVQPPVYFPFYNTIKNAGMIQVNNQLVMVDGKYRMNFEELESLLPDAKAIIICNPHNPVGRKWNLQELTALVKLCHKHNVLILSDEIHSDLIHRGRFIPLAAISDEATKLVITFNSTGKSFNTAGLHGGYIIFPNEDMRKTYQDYAKSQSTPGPNCFNVVANIAAYNQAEAWFDNTLHLIQENIKLVVNRFHQELPRVKVDYPEATYLMWLDFSDYGLSDEELFQKIVAAGVGLNRGTMFGPGGEDHMRLNAASPADMLNRAIDQLVEAFKE